jgi:hypothetical protein
MTRLRTLFRDRSVNAAIAWAVIAVLLGSAVRIVADGDLLWAGFAAVVVGVALLPPLAARDWTVQVSWVVLAAAAAPVALRMLGVAPVVTPYVAVVALALVIVTEVRVFTPVKMPPWFAVVFVVLTTMSVASLWGMAQYASDVYLGTSFIAGSDDLMWDLVIAAGVGIGAGLAFELYAERSESITSITEGVEES